MLELPRGWVMGKLVVGTGPMPAMVYRVLREVEWRGFSLFDREERTEEDIAEVVGFLLGFCAAHELRVLVDGGVLMQPATMNNMQSGRSWIVFNSKATTRWPKDKDDEAQGCDQVQEGAVACGEESADGVPVQEEG